MTPGNLPLRNPMGANGGLMGMVQATRNAVEGLTTDVMHNRRPGIPGRVLQSRIAVITDQGPEGNEGEPSANQYWCKFQRVDYDDTQGFRYSDEERPGLAGIVKAQNLAEYFDSHGLRNDESEYVTVHRISFNAAIPVMGWVFERDTHPILMKITASTQDGTNKRWKYTATEVEYTSTGFGGATTVSSGITLNSGIWDYAYNLIEDINGATGTYGNGTVSTDFSATSYALKPVPNNVVLPMWIKWPDASTKPFMVFSTANGLAGGC